MAEQIIGSTQYMWQIDSNQAGLVTGSVAITNASIAVDVNVNDYVSVAPSGQFFTFQSGLTNYKVVPSGNYFPVAITNINNGSFVSLETHDGYNALVVDTPDFYTSGWLGFSGDTVELEVHGQGAVIMNVSGTWTGKIKFEGTVDNDTWTNLSVVQPGGAMTFNGIQNDNQNGNYRVPMTAGYSRIRAKMTDYTNGSAYVYYNASAPVGAIFSYQLNQSNMNATVYQTNASGLYATVAQSGNGWKTLGSDVITNTVSITPSGNFYTVNNDVIVHGSINALNGSVYIPFTGKQSSAAVISGASWSGLMRYEGTCNGGSTWTTCWVSTVNQSPVAQGIPSPTQDITSNGTYKVFQTAGYTGYRIRAGSWNTGVADVTMSAVNAAPSFIYTAGAVIQQVAADESNSSTANLNAGSTFTGTSQNTLGVNSIQVSLKTDQNCTIYVDQSSDGNNWDITDSYDYYYSLGGTGFTVQAVTSYYRIRVTNNGSSTTTYFRLQTCLCPIVEALPRSLDEVGNLKVGIKSIQDGYGFGVENTPTGEMRVAEPYRLVGTNFIGNTFDTNFWNSTLTSGGLATVGGGQCVLTTGSTANATSAIQSVRSARYVGASANRYRAVVHIPDSGLSFNVRRFGAFNSTDGAFFQFSGTTFGVCTRYSGVDTVVNNGSFNGVLGNTFTPGTNVRTYETYWTNSKVWFVIGDDILHTVSANTSPWSQTTTLPVRAENYNYDTGSTNVALNVRVSTISRLGKGESESTFKYISGAGTVVCKYAAGKLHNIILSDGANGTNITLFDNAASGGTVIGKFNTSSVSTPSTLTFDCPFSNGLTAVTVGTVAYTVTYE